jgi:hypothetical protein
VIVRNPLLILLVALVLLVGVLGAWLFTRTDSSEPSRAASAEESVRDPSNAKRNAHELEGARAAASDVDTSRETASTPAAEPQAKLDASPRATAVLEARFVDTNRSPLAHVHATISSSGEHAADSGGDGIVRIDVPLDVESREVRLRATAFGCADFATRVRLERGKTTKLGDLVLQVGGEIAGVVLGPDGLPFEGARISAGDDLPPRDPDMARVSGPDLPEGAPTTKSAARGAFRLSGIPAHTVRLWVTADDMRHTCSDAIDVQPRQVHEGVTLKLEPLASDERIDGVVVSPDGAPVPNASLHYSWSNGSTSWGTGTNVGGDGRFHIHAPKKVPFELRAGDPKNRWQDASRSDVLPGARDVVLQLREPRWLDVAVVSSSKPVAEFNATARAQSNTTAYTDNESKSHPDGHARVMIPTSSFRIEIVARGYATKTLGPFDPENAPASVTAELELLPGLRGRVTSHGKPVSGATVELHKIVGRGEHVMHNGSIARLHPEAAESASSDTDGFYHLTARDDGTFAILCIANGYALAELSPVDVAAVKGEDGLDFALVAGGAIEGHVLVAQGMEASNLIVRINRGDARARTLRTGVDGAFRFDGLTPGRWHVLHSQDEIRPDRSSTSSWDGDPQELEVPWNCVVEDGRTTRFDVDARDAVPCVFNGHVEVNHAPAAGWTVHVAPSMSFAFQLAPGGTVDASGDVRVEVAEPGSYKVTLHPPASSMPQGEFSANVNLARGPNAWKTAFDVGALDGASGVVAPTTHYTIDGAASGVVFHAELPLDDSGACHFPMALAGACTVQRIERDATSGWHEAAKLDVQVLAGAKQSIVMP